MRRYSLEGEIDLSPLDTPMVPQKNKIGKLKGVINGNDFKNISLEANKSKIKETDCFPNECAQKGASLMMIWDKNRQSKLERMESVRQYTDGKVIATESIVPFLECVIRPKDRVVLEGCNQKQAAFLAFVNTVNQV